MHTYYYQVNYSTPLSLCTVRGWEIGAMQETNWGPGTRDLRGYKLNHSLYAVSNLSPLIQSNEALATYRFQLPIADAIE